MNEELLLQVPFFSDLPRGEIKYLAFTLQAQSFPAGAILFHEDEVGDNLYIVIEGEVEVALGAGSPDEKVLAVLGRGECIGEMSLLMPGGKRTATARVKTAARLWVMTREDFDDLLHRQPHLAYAIVKVLSRRLDATNTAAFNDLLEKNRELQEAYDDLKAAQAQIIEKEKMEKELQLAADIQVSILPQTLPHVAGFDFGGRMDPARAVGGDFYDVFSIDAQRVGVLIGDVADKGVPSALFMARTHALLTSEAMRGAGPAEVVQQVNDYLTRVEQADLFVTVIYGILHLGTGEFTFARAGHELPLLVRATGKVTRLPKGQGQPIGLFEDIPLDAQTVKIPADGTLLLFTDGMVDCRNPEGERFGHERFERELVALAGLGAQESCDRLMQTLSAHQGGAAQDDDVTLVAIHRGK
jgi:sigma-B regulation protein RsbU (phosphoserine phosphatase)